MTTYQQLLGQFTIGASTDTIDLDDNDIPTTPTISLTQGNYYIDELCDHIEDQIQAEGGNFASVTCSYSATTGKVTMGEATSQDIDVTWTDTALRDLLGFTGNFTVGDGGAGSASVTATNEARYCWRPDKGIAGHPVARDVVWEPVSNSVVYVSRDGTTSSVEGNLVYFAELEWRWIAGERVYTPSTGSVNKDLQQFFEDVIHAGRTVRYYPDTSSASYETCIVGTGEGTIGALTDYAKQLYQNNLSWWGVQLPVLKNVS